MLKFVMKYLAVIIVLCLLQQSWAKEEKENKTFVATREWQEIPEGQGVPAGLHIRINLENGKKEAKILEENDDGDGDEVKEHQYQQHHHLSDKVSAVSVVPEGEDVSEEGDDDKGRVKKQKKVKHLDEALQRIGIDYTPKEKVENIIREYRSYEELKKSFEGMRKPFKTDGEIIVQLIEEFQTTSTAVDNKDAKTRVKTQKQILESFNYLMSQFDNALIFVDKGGLEQVLLPILVNSTQLELKVEVMRVLGAMAQNNPHVQIKVFERNVGSHLSQIIMTSTNTQELSAALYGFSSLLRKFPLAQEKMLSTSGTQALMSVLNRDCELKIKVKAIAIIGDLLQEAQFAASLSAEDPLAAAQYSKVQLYSRLIHTNYCEVMEKIVDNHALSLLESPDYIEYILNALNQTHLFCFDVWGLELVRILTVLRKQLSQSQDEYHLEVAELLGNYLRTVYGGLFTHDEL